MGGIDHHRAPLPGGFLGAVGGEGAVEGSPAPRPTLISLYRLAFW